MHQVLWFFQGEVGVLSDDEGLDLPHPHQRLPKPLPHVLLPGCIVEGHIELLEVDAEAHKIVKAIVRSSRDHDRFDECRELRIGPEDVVEDGGKLLGRSDDYCVIQQRGRDPEEGLVHQEDG